MAARESVSMADAALRAIDDCTRLTEAMVQAARQGDWERVERLDAERRPCFSQVVFDEVAAGDLDSIVDRFRALVAMDGRLSALADDERSRALSALRSSRGKARGSATYRELASR